jgi:hypothetical protein
MAKLIMYLLESSVVLAFFYLIYVLVLQKETFFSLNRFFLLAILVVSLLFPWLSFDFNPTKVVAVEHPLEEISKIRTSYYEAMALWEHNSSGGGGTTVPGTPPESRTDWGKYPLIGFLMLYVVGTGVCLSRTFWTLRWIWKMIAIYTHVEMEGVKVIQVPFPTAPFSFFTYVFVHDEMVGTPEFHQILAHERTHIQQKHSIDLVFVQLLAAFFWFNPVIWRLIKSLKTTHEYIADNKIINAGYSLVEYQTLLLKQLISNNSFGLVHNFNLSFIKKRITMMTHKKSGWQGKVKVAIAIAATLICCAIIIQCNSKLEEQEISPRSPGAFTHGINLPVLPATGFAFHGDTTDALSFNIRGDKLTINGEPRALDEISDVIAEGIPTMEGYVVMRVDRNQKMGFVRSVQQELRIADRRKILYLAQTETGAKVESVLLLPPTLEGAVKNGTPMEPDISALEAEGTLDVLKIDLGNDEGVVNQQVVYGFVSGHMQKQSSDYVVGARFDDDDTYGTYLLNLTYVKEGFHQHYQERAHEMFGKDYFDLDKEEFYAVRQGIPMAISISENEKK